MTLVDWLIVAFTVCFAVYGYAQGFLVGALSLVGFAAGAFLGTRLAPALLSRSDQRHLRDAFGIIRSAQAALARSYPLYYVS